MMGKRKSGAKMDSLQPVAYTPTDTKKASLHSCANPKSRSCAPASAQYCRQTAEAMEKMLTKSRKRLVCGRGGTMKSVPLPRASAPRPQRMQMMTMRSSIHQSRCFLVASSLSATRRKSWGKKAGMAASPGGGAQSIPSFLVL